MYADVLAPPSLTCPRYDVSVVDLWSNHTPWPYNLMPNWYSFLVSNGWMWASLYKGSSNQGTPQMLKAIGTQVARRVHQAFVELKPDVVVSVHPLMQHVPLRVMHLKGLEGKIPFATVVTDYATAHPTWFHKRVNFCCVPTDNVASEARQVGLREDQIRQHGLPIRVAFADARKMQPRALRRKLGMDLKLPAVLIVGGGEGMGPLMATVEALEARLAGGKGGKPLGQVVVICGRNRKLVGDLQARKWGMPVHPLGFVTNMVEWMRACDCIVTKAGPGTIAESLICGLPLILNNYIPGQEFDNIGQVTDNNVGIFETDPARIADKVAFWFGPGKSEREDMSRRALKLGKPQATFEIVKDLAALESKATPAWSA